MRRALTVQEYTTAGPEVRVFLVEVDARDALPGDVVLGPALGLDHEDARVLLAHVLGPFELDLLSVAQRDARAALAERLERADAIEGDAVVDPLALAVQHLPGLA